MRTGMSFADRGAGLRKDNAILELASNFRRLDRNRKLVLLSLATLGSFVLLAVCIYILVPGVLRDTTPDVTRLVMPTVGATNITLSGRPNIAGQYVLSDTKSTPLILDLQQFGMNITGTLTAQSCSATLGQAAVTIVTGHLIDDTTLDLTLSKPEDPHSTHIVYALAASSTGFTLKWSNGSGYQQSQHWLPVTPEQVRTPLLKTCKQ